MASTHSWSDDESSSSPRTTHTADDPEDAPALELKPLRLRGISGQIIEEELHTDIIITDAVNRLDLTTPPHVAQATGNLQALATPNWKYGLNGELDLPTTTGLKVSFKALLGGTGVDEQALPNWLRMKHLASTDKVIKARRKRGKAKARK